MVYKQSRFHSLATSKTWRAYLRQQLSFSRQYAHPEFLRGLAILDFPLDFIPDLNQVSDVICEATGWRLQPVKGIVKSRHFYDMLASKIFPISQKIRPFDQVDFYQSESPDLFHELYGHCPYLTNKKYASTLHELGKIAQHASVAQAKKISKLFWYVFESGLIKYGEEVKVLGATVLSSKSEMLRALQPQYQKPFSLDDILYMSFNVDGIQEKYFVIESVSCIYELISKKLLNIGEYEDFGNDRMHAALSDKPFFML